MSNCVPLNGIRTGTPVPRTSNERTTKSDVKTEQWGPERVADYLAKRYPELNRQPAPKKSQKNEMREELIDMGTESSLTKEAYLEKRRAGLNRTRIQKESGLNTPAFYKLLTEWGIKDSAVEQVEMDKADPKPEPNQQPNIELRVEEKQIGTADSIEVQLEPKVAERAPVAPQKTSESLEKRLDAVQKTLAAAALELQPISIEVKGRDSLFDELTNAARAIMEKAK